MNIPDEVIEQAAWLLIEDDTDTADRGVTDDHYRERLADVKRMAPLIAEWARKEALREAAEAAQDYIYEWRRVDNGDTFVEGIAIHTATVIRALVGGDKTDD